MVQLGPSLFERFERGVFARQSRDPSRVKLCFDHGQVIGKCESLTETGDGLRFVARISGRDGIPEARRARDLLADGLVDELSVGFRGVTGGTESRTRPDGSTLLTHHRAQLLEISLTPWGVYGRDATLNARALLVDPGVVAALDERAQRRAAERAWVSGWRAKVAREARPQRPPVSPRPTMVPRSGTGTAPPADPTRPSVGTV